MRGMTIEDIRRTLWRANAELGWSGPAAYHGQAGGERSLWRIKEVPFESD